MAKFELRVYNTQNGEVEKTVKRGFMPLAIYVRFQKLAEKAASDKYKSDEAMYEDLREPVLDLFPELTAEEYRNNVDIAEVLQLWKRILDKSSEISDEDSKNA